MFFTAIVFTFLVTIFGWDWTGFTSEESKITIISTSKEGTTAKELQSGKTLWDWMQLLFVPTVLTLGAVWITARQNHDLQIAADNQRESTLLLKVNSYCRQE